MNPFSGVRVEVGLRCSVAQGIITDPDCQVNVKNLWGNQTLDIHQPTRGQLEKKLAFVDHIFIYNAKQTYYETKPFIFFFLTHLAVVKRLFLGASLDQELVCQSPVFCAVTIAVSGNSACLPVSIKSRLKTCV